MSDVLRPVGSGCAGEKVVGDGGAGELVVHGVLSSN